MYRVYGCKGTSEGPVGSRGVGTCDAETVMREHDSRRPQRHTNRPFRTWSWAVAALLEDFATEYEVYEGFACQDPSGGGGHWAERERKHGTPSHSVNAAWYR